MSLPFDPKLGNLKISYERAVVAHKTAQTLEQEARLKENEARNHLYAYIRELGYCPHCELLLRHCLGHGKAT
jgi:hypothetical protein